MDDSEEVTMFPQRESKNRFKKCATLQFLPTASIIIIITVIFYLLFNRFSPADDEKNELKTIVKYVEDCKQGISYDQNSYTETKLKPNISVIIPICNSNRFINTAYKSIVNQSFKKVQILFINDLPLYYLDNDLIEFLQENDKRITLIKNKKNYGSFYSRNIDTLLAKGKYIQFLDVDDLLVNDILEKSFDISEKNNLDVVQYPYISVFKDGTKKIRYLETTKGIIHQPELRDIMCYEYGVLIERLHKYMLWDKLIKKEVFLNALRFIGKENIKVRYAFADDTLSAYAVTNAAQSYTYLNEPGYYYYVIRPGSITAKKSSVDKSNLSVKYPFKIVKIVFDKAEDNTQSKRKALCFFRHFNRVFWSKTSKFLLDNEAVEAMNSVVNTFVNSIYIDQENKEFAKNVRKEIFSKLGKVSDREEDDKIPSVFDEYDL